MEDHCCAGDGNVYINFRPCKPVEQNAPFTTLEYRAVIKLTVGAMSKFYLPRI